jgi:hypothetical protein
MQTRGVVLPLVVDKDAIQITDELAAMARAGEVSGLALVVRTTERQYHVLMTGVFEEDPVVASGASGLLRKLAEMRAIKKMGN